MMIRNRVPRALIIAVLAALSATLFSAAPTAAAEVAATSLSPFILVSGEADISVAPDVATLGLGVLSQSARAQDAQHQVAKRMAEVLAAIERQGVSKDDIQTSALELTPLYAAPVGGSGYDQNRPITGYRASVSLTLKIKDLPSVGKVLDAAVSAGANQVHYLSFGLLDEHAARKKALAEAAREARDKAETLAKALNLRLGRILEVAESGSLIQPRYGATLARAMSSIAAPESTPIESGKVKVSAKVTMKVTIASQLRSIAEPGDSESSTPGGH